MAVSIVPATLCGECDYTCESTAATGGQMWK